MPPKRKLDATNALIRAASQPPPPRYSNPNIIPGYGQVAHERHQRTRNRNYPIFHDGSGGAWARPVFRPRGRNRPTRPNPGSAYNRGRKRWS